MQNVQYRSTAEADARLVSVNRKHRQKRRSARASVRRVAPEDIPTKLTGRQRVILSAAAGRDDGALLPLPPSLTLNKGVTTRVLRGLVQRGLAAEITAAPGDTVWRMDDDGERLTLVITDQGLTALGIEHHSPRRRQTDQKDTKPDIAAAKRPGCSKSSKQSEKAAQRPGDAPKPATRIDVVIELLRRDEGATVADLRTATGWQAHSVRGMLSGTVRKKVGCSVTSSMVEGRGRVYRIAAEEVSQ